MTYPPMNPPPQEVSRRRGSIGVVYALAVGATTGIVMALFIFILAQWEDSRWSGYDHEYVIMSVPQYWILLFLFFLGPALVVAPALISLLTDLAMRRVASQWWHVLAFAGAGALAGAAVSSYLVFWTNLSALVVFGLAMPATLNALGRWLACLTLDRVPAPIGPDRFTPRDGRRP